MIYTVTFNPAIDYVVRLDRELRVGDVNRASGEDCVLGGKGINVSGVLAQLGCESVALGFVAGETGAWLERGLAAQGLKTDFVRLAKGMTRINVKIKAGQETELNGAGPDIPEDAMRALEEKLDRLQQDDILVLAGSIPGALLLKNVDARAIKLVFGVVVAVFGVEMLSREYRKKKVRSSKLVLAIIGVTAGVLCGLFGVGALLAAYVSRVTEGGGSFKANISAVFIVDNTFRIVLYSALGLLTLDTVKSVLLLIPFALLGLYAGIKCSSCMDEKLVRKITSVLLVLSGISLILKNL